MSNNDKLFAKSICRLIDGCEFSKDREELERIANGNVESQPSTRRIVVEVAFDNGTRKTKGKRYVFSTDHSKNSVGEHVWSYRDDYGTPRNCYFMESWIDNNHVNHSYNYICEYHDGLNIQTVGREGGDEVLLCVSSDNEQQTTVGRKYAATHKQAADLWRIIGDDGKPTQAWASDFQSTAANQATVRRIHSSEGQRRWQEETSC